MEVNNTETKEKCIAELTIIHNSLVACRFSTMILNRENAIGKPLNDAEIEDLKVRFDDEIYLELLMSRRGK
jgi:hypothetical protein